MTGRPLARCRCAACRDEYVRVNGSQIQLDFIGQSIAMQRPAQVRKPAPCIIEALLIPCALNGNRNQIAALHAATSAKRSACCLRKSAACWALDAAVKMARLSAFRTLSQDWMYCAW